MARIIAAATRAQFLIAVRLSHTKILASPIWICWTKDRTRSRSSSDASLVQRSASFADRSSTARWVAASRPSGATASLTSAPDAKSARRRSSTSPSVSLAVRTEDHPLEYLNFEGSIPKGEYGAGSMIVWDRGRWEPEGDPQKGLAKGHLAFTLDGTRLKGRWHLVRMQPRSGEKTEPWLLIKSDDEFGRHIGDREIADEETTSHISGRTSEELAATGELRNDHAARVGVAKARKASLPNVGKLSGA